MVGELEDFRTGEIGALIYQLESKVSQVPILKETSKRGWWGSVSKKNERIAPPALSNAGVIAIVGKLRPVFQQVATIVRSFNVYRGSFGDEET